MRDALILVVIVGWCVVALRRPWLGVMLWTLVSVMNPHVEFGWRAANWPVASMAAVATLTGLLFTRDRHTPLIGSPVWWLLAFSVWICVTLPFSIYYERSELLWERSMKIYLMLFVTLALLDTRRHVHWFVVVMVVSLGYYGVKGGIFTLLTGGNYRVWGPGGFVEGNNELALALIMTIPLMRYLQMQSAQRLVRIAWGVAMVLTAIAALGSHSRGAFLAFFCMGFFLWLKGRNKLLLGVVFAAGLVAFLPLMPEHWWERMETIKTYQQDQSALGRINAWWNAWNLARDRFFGGGFHIYSAEVFLQYSPEPERVHAAHSIYFQVLGEHGFVGLALFLGIGVTTWLCCGRLIATARRDASARWAGDLGAMIQVSMIGYATGGAFLSLAYYDLPYNLMAAAVLAQWVLTRERVRATSPGGLGVTAAAKTG